MTELNTEAPKPSPRTKKEPKETETGVVLANLTATKTGNTKEPEIVNLGNGITAINR